jgi:hypothetical protein
VRSLFGYLPLFQHHYLVGKNVEKTEKTVKQVKQKLGLQDSVNQKEKPKKEKGFFKNLFKK